LLSLTATEPPRSLDPDVVRDERLELLESLRSSPATRLTRTWVRAQYGPGFIMGKPVVGIARKRRRSRLAHRNLRRAGASSSTTWRWAGVPFFLRTGKHLPKAGREFRCTSKTCRRFLFNANPAARLDPNVLSIRIQPDEGFSLAISSKVPGPAVRIYPVKMDFHYGGTFGGSTPEAYERLLLDVMHGDQTLFMRRDAVEAAWRFVTRFSTGGISDHRNPCRRIRPVNGTSGGGPADRSTGRRWRAL